RETVEARRRGEIPDRLLLLEHPPVVTLGRRGDEANLRLDRASLAARGVEVHRVSRGGDVTYHGPGQLVGYAVVDLAARGRPDVHRFLRLQEAALIETLARLGVAGTRRPGLTGVFVAGAPQRKIASIGIGLRGWVSHHGFALNLSVDLSGFEAIVPCGLSDIEMTSVSREGEDASPADLALRARHAIADAFPRHLRLLAGGESGLYTAPACRAG
ncbi:MAG: lipoyl(octanoyl) transferase LipB, partial [Myxococcota bacterium]